MKATHFIYTKAVRPLLFFLTDPEQIHEVVIKLGYGFGRIPPARFATQILFSYKHPSLEQTIKNLDFPNPVGLSAGFDKDADLINILPSLGFGYAQVGTITNNPYGGNPKPRLYRLPKSKSIIVNYGLKNIGVDLIIEKIKRARHSNLTLGISIGRTNHKDTVDIERGIEDIYACLDKIIKSDMGSFHTINISCPNLFGGESFTTPIALQKLLEKIYTLPIAKPVFIKMPANLPWEEFDKLVQVALAFNVSGITISNLNKNLHDPAIKEVVPDTIKGSASGLPTQKLSNELIAKTYKKYGNKLVIIGVGGIFSAEDAYEKIKNGASLVQLVTGLIFEGPQIVGQINKGLVKLMRRDGYNHIREVVGVNHK